MTSYPTRSGATDSVRSASARLASSAGPTKHGPPLLRTIMSHQDRSAPLLYVPADRRSKMRFAAWQGGTPEIVSGFASLDAGRSTKGTGLSADARTTPSSGLDGPRCASVGPP